MTAPTCPKGGTVESIGTCYDGCCDKYRCSVCGLVIVENAD